MQNINKQKSKYILLSLISLNNSIFGIDNSPNLTLIEIGSSNFLEENAFQRRDNIYLYLQLCNIKNLLNKIYSEYELIIKRKYGDSYYNKQNNIICILEEISKTIKEFYDPVNLEIFLSLEMWEHNITMITEEGKNIEYNIILIKIYLWIYWKAFICIIIYYLVMKKKFQLPKRVK